MKQFRSHTKYKRTDSYSECSSFYMPTMQHNFAVTQSRNSLIVTKRGQTDSRTSGMTSFFIGTNRTIGTNRPSELPCTQLDHMIK